MNVFVMINMIRCCFSKGRMHQLKTLPRSVWSVWAAQRVNGNPYAGGGG